jgi:hypothetical protein
VGVDLLGLNGYRRRQQPPSIRPPHRFGSDATEVSRAGARIAWWNATVPMVTMTFDSDWLRIEGVPTYDVWIERARVTNIRAVGRWFSPGLMFDTTDGVYDGVIVWFAQRTRRDNVLRLLADREWAVAAAAAPRT